jgi:hypothetical protein
MASQVRPDGAQVNPLGYTYNLVAQMPTGSATKKAIVAHILHCVLDISQQVACKMADANPAYVAALDAMDTNLQSAVEKLLRLAGTAHHQARTCRAQHGRDRGC